MLPKNIGDRENIHQLQQELLRTGQFIPGARLEDPHDLVRSARVSTSSQLQLAALPPDGPLMPLTYSLGQMLPLNVGSVPRLSILVDAAEQTTLRVELRTSDRPDNYTPDVMLAAKEIELDAGPNQLLELDFAVSLKEARYVFLCLIKNPLVAVRSSHQRITGLLSIANAQNPAVSNFGLQQPSAGLGVETFEFWCPQRRPNGHNLALMINPPLDVFAPINVVNGIARPTNAPNAWVSAIADTAPMLTLDWEQSQTIARLDLTFDTDFDHPMESVLMTHPETAMPCCVKRYQIEAADGQIVAVCDNNYQTRNTLHFTPPLVTDRLKIRLQEMHGNAPGVVFEVRCYQ